MKGPLLLEADPSLWRHRNVHMADVLVPDADAEKGTARVMLTNCLGFTQKLEHGDDVGAVLPVDLVESGEKEPGAVARVATEEKHMTDTEGEEEGRKEKLRDMLHLEPNGTPEQKQLGALLEDHHDVFSLAKDDRGETQLVELHIDTGDAAPSLSSPLCGEEGNSTEPA